MVKSSRKGDGVKKKLGFWLRIYQKRSTGIADLILFAGFCRRQNAINCHSFRPNSCREREKKNLKREKNYFHKMKRKQRSTLSHSSKKYEAQEQENMSQTHSSRTHMRKKVRRFWLPTSLSQILAYISTILHQYISPFSPYFFPTSPTPDFTCTLSFP